MSDQSAAGRGPGKSTKGGSTSGIGNRSILVVLCLCSFSTLFNVRSISPILVDVSHAYGISVGQAGSLGAAYSLPAAFLSLVFGPLSDRYGRRNLMLVGLSALVLTSLGGALSPSFGFLLASRILAGVAAAAVVPSTFASFGDFFPYSERGRAMAWQVAITTMAIVVGLPAGSVLAGLLSWRWMFGLLAIVFAIVTTLVFTRLPRGTTKELPESGLAHYRNSFASILRSRSAVAALVASGLFSMFWQSWATYNGAFFIQTFNIPVEGLAPILTIHGLAAVLIATVGGRITDRFAKKNVAAIAMGACSIIIALITNTAGVFWIAVALNTLLAVPAGMRIISANALLTELVPQARGTMMSMNTSIMEIGSMIGITIGGIIIDSTGGYTGLGSFYGAMVLLGSLVIYFFVTEAAGSVRPAPAESASG